MLEWSDVVRAALVVAGAGFAFVGLCAIALAMSAGRGEDERD